MKSTLSQLQVWEKMSLNENRKGQVYKVQPFTLGFPKKRTIRKICNLSFTEKGLGMKKESAGWFCLLTFKNYCCILTEINMFFKQESLLTICQYLWLKCYENFTFEKEQRISEAVAKRRSTLNFCIRGVRCIFSRGSHSNSPKIATGVKVKQSLNIPLQVFLMQKVEVHINFFFKYLVSVNGHILSHLNFWYKSLATTIIIALVIFLTCVNV